jgi:transposase
MHPNEAPRRRYDSEFKARVVAACNEPGASVAGVARAHDLNANLVQKWRRGRGMGSAALPAPKPLPIERAAEFVCVSLPAAPAAVASAMAAQNIRIELKRGAMAVAVSWPSLAATDCAAWLRELLR